MKFKLNKYYRYINGNYIVVGTSGTKSPYRLEKRALRVGEGFISEFPDSIDLKISDKCSHGCPFCHESSIPNGKVCNPEKTIEILSQLPKKPIEVAIGGGNVLECLPETNQIIDWLNKEGYRTRITITLDDLNTDKNKDELLRLFDKIEGLGISVTSLKGINLKKKSPGLFVHNFGFFKAIKLWEEIPYEIHKVFHIIAGIFPISDFKKLVEFSDIPILVLGYKQWGRAYNTEVPDMSEWKKVIKDAIYNLDSEVKCIGFDNLACEQLEVQKIIGKNYWDSIYLGDEGSCSMYIDAVKGEFARTSRSSERVGWDKIKLLDFYASLSK